MFVGILLRDSARDFNVEIESSRHREIFEISSRGPKTIGSHLKKNNFTITTEIHARSLANFYCQYADRHKFKIHAARQRARAGNSTICYHKKTN